MIGATSGAPEDATTEQTTLRQLRIENVLLRSELDLARRYANGLEAKLDELGYRTRETTQTDALGWEQGGAADDRPTL